MNLRERILALASCVLLACGSLPSVDIVLTPDPGLNTPETILERIDSLVMVLDSPDGLYPDGAAQILSPDAQIKNADLDPPLEYVASVQIPRGRLPRIRIERDPAPNPTLDVRLIGLSTARAETYVQATLSGVQLKPEATEMLMPFNLLPRYLPPRVVEAIPAEDDTVPSCPVRTVTVMFSKAVDPRSVLAPGAFSVRPALESATITATVSHDGRVASFVFPDAVPTEGYELVLSHTIVDTFGQALDQRPSEPGLQPFRYRFLHLCSSESEPRACELGGQHCAGDGRLRCAKRACIPNRCERSRCDQGFVCDPLGARCEIDCRGYGDFVCPPERPQCEPTRGVCTDANG